ncbi:hypothetical protein ACF09E_01185 [Streptomyces sp. NPDC014891]|uniref:hypothetical protein n=1 Tax=Streptomyces sp. NPDC014891 TaxID=3364929 RepID=UPI0036FA9CF3
MSEQHAPPPRPPRVLRVLRATAAAQAAVLLVQAVSAGLLLASVPVGRSAHGTMAGAVVLAVALHLAAAVAARRRGAVATRTVLQAAPLPLFTLAQAALGFAHVRELHVPLGVLMFGVSVMTLMRIRALPPLHARPPSPVAARNAGAAA